MQTIKQAIKVVLALEALRRAILRWRIVRAARIASLVLLALFGIGVGAGVTAIVVAAVRRRRREALQKELPRAIEAGRQPAVEPGIQESASARAVATSTTDDQVLSDAGACPESHPVKGIKRSGIYHTPESPWYKRAKADVCFADEAGAERAGYRRAGK